MTPPVSVPHQLVLTDRHQLTVSGVSDVDSFDESGIIAHTSLGELTIRGRDLQICRFNIDSGDLSVEGHIDCVEYSAEQLKHGLFGKLFK